MHKRSVRLLLGAALTAAVAYLLVVHMDKVRANVSQRDSIQYWAAGKLLITHKIDQFWCAPLLGHFSSFCR